MKKLYVYIASLIIMTSLLWLQAEPTALNNSSFFQWRSSLMQLSGILAFLLISMTMLLALRLPLIEKLTKGLDKSYFLHKWLGIYGVTLGIFHWLLAILPKELVQLGILEKPIKPKSKLDPDSLQGFFHSLRGNAETIGEWSIYVFIFLGLIALIKAIKYRHFLFSHKLMSVAYIAIVYHSVVLLKASYWDKLITLIIITIAIVGIFSALKSLFNLIGNNKKHQGNITSIEFDEINKTTKVIIKLPTWQGHQAGQFAFVKIAGEEAHPFTISGVNKKEIEFTIKALGDFTTDLPKRLSIMEQVVVEGPYGDFNFADNKNQIWIAGGIGCAAFKDRIKILKGMKSDKSISFYYCTQAPSPKLIEEFKQATKEANIIFHLIDNRTMTLLTIEQLKQQEKHLNQSSIWYCGPVNFGQALKKQLKENNYDLKHFHTELFNFR